METAGRRADGSSGRRGPEEHGGMETGRLHKVISVEHGGMETGPRSAPGGPDGGIPEEPGGMETLGCKLGRKPAKGTWWEGNTVGWKRR